MGEQLTLSAGATASETGSSKPAEFSKPEGSSKAAGSPKASSPKSLSSKGSSSQKKTSSSPKKTSRRRERTSTETFGSSGQRYAHDSSPFYRRFPPVEVSDDTEVCSPVVTDEIFCGDVRTASPDQLAAKSVGLVFTSPPYFAGKDYELSDGVVPESYTEYLEMLHGVFAACKEASEPGAAIVVNVANLGRRPYRSLSSDVIRILSEELGLFLEGEVIWRKAHGANGSAAWGSYMSASAPKLRDTTERLIVARRGRPGRVWSAKEREKLGLPHRNSISAEEFQAATLDVWEIPPESAKRVGHPAPFPVALAQRVIELYAYEEDLVLDPFMGSGSTAVAATQTNRRFVGFDLVPEYVDLARTRVAEAQMGASTLPLET